MDIKSNSSGSYKGTIWAVNATLGASSSGDIIVKGK
jgi:predicted ABC-type transport system involved in lysophospholipase L1 biosynthesis ATPase subunit